MGRACMPIHGKLRMRAYPWTVAHVRTSMDSRACTQLTYSLLVEQSRRDGEAVLV